MQIPCVYLPGPAPAVTVANSKRKEIGEEPLKVFKFFNLSLNIYKYNRNAALQRKWMEIVTFLPIAAWDLYIPCLLLADGLISQIFHHT
jgi:hypothetical protein